MNTKDDSILFGAKHAGITWLFKFYSRKTFDRVREDVKRYGMSLAEFLCRRYPDLTGAPKLPEEPRKFTEDDSKTVRLKVQILECDEFTRTCLERQAKSEGAESVEEYINWAVFHMLAVDEEDAIIDARTGEVVLNRCALPCSPQQTYKADKGVPPVPYKYYKPVKRIPAGTIVEQYA